MKQRLNISGAGAVPSARLLAQMRAATGAHGLPESYAELMAQSGLSVQMADDVAAALAELQKVAEPFAVDAEKLHRMIADLLATVAGQTPAAPSNPDQKPAQQPAMRDTLTAQLKDRLLATLEAQDRRSPVSRGAAYATARGPHEPTIGREFASMRLADLVGGGRYGSRHAAMAGGILTTSDFPNALATASNKVLLDQYEAAQSALKLASREVSAADFRPINSVRVSGSLTLAKVQESGEFTNAAIHDAGEAFAVETYGKIITLSRQAIVNDDLGAFANSSRMMGTGAAQTEAKLFAALLTRNSGAGPTMSDNKTLFHADHGNVAASGAAPSITTLAAARTGMRRQKGIGGEVIVVQPY